MTYDPQTALAAYQQAGKPVGQAVPDAYDIQPKPATLCFPLLAFVESAPALPDDFHNVPRSSEGLKRYVRPDGGVFIGLFELPNMPTSTIVVFGDPLMELAEAKRVSIQFRRRLMQIIEDAERDEIKQRAGLKLVDEMEFAGKPSSGGDA